MAQVHLRQTCLRLPLTNPQLIKSHPLCPKVGVWLGDQVQRNLIDDTLLTKQGTSHAFDADSFGTYAKTTATNNYWSAGNLSGKFNGAGTVLMLLRAGSIGGANENYPIECGPGQEYPYVGDNNIYCGIFASGRWISAAAPVKDITSKHWLVVQAETNNFRISQDNLTVATSGSTTFTAPTAIDVLGTSSTCFTRGAYFTGIDNRRWTDEEVAEFIDNPGVIFRQPRKRTWFRSQWISGNINESLAIIDWRATAVSALDGTEQGTTVSTGSTYSVECDQITPCVVTLHPKFDYLWSASKVVALGDLCVPSNPEATHKLYEATDIGSAPHQTHATTEPTWPASGTVVDNDITWTFVADLVDPISLGPKIPS
jgi:hypothetical protein